MSRCQNVLQNLVLIVIEETSIFYTENNDWWHIYHIRNREQGVTVSPFNINSKSKITYCGNFPLIIEECKSLLSWIYGDKKKEKKKDLKEKNYAEEINYQMSTELK